MARRKKVKKAAGGKRDGRLENLIRFEIVVVLFSLIGLYYFLSFSPVRMPADPVRSSYQVLGPVSAMEANLDDADQPVTGSANQAAINKEPAGEDSEGDASAAALPEKAVAEVNAPGTDAPPGSLSGSEDGSSRVAETAASEALKAQGEGQPTEADEQLQVAVKVEKEAASAGVVVVEAAENKVLTVESRSLPSALPVRKTSHSPKPKSKSRRKIEVGAYVLETEVRSAEEKLQTLKLPFTSFRQKRPTPMYRVYLGPFASQSSVEEAMAAARRLGDQPFLRRDGELTQVVIGSFYLQSSVVAWENLYHDAGLNPQVAKETISLPRTVLLVEDQSVLQAADSWLEKLRAAGFPAVRLVDKLR